MSENTTSKSQAKRQARREEIKKSQREEKRVQLILTTAGIALTVIFLVIAGTFIYRQMTQTVSSSDYSALLNEDGTVKDLNPLDYVDPYDYQNMSVSANDITYSEESIDADIETLLSEHQTLETDSALTAADGDTLNIDYVGTVDGVAFEGGDTEGNGADLVLGSGTYVDTFEEQLVGSHPGDQVTVNVTFPEDYTNEELQGKAAVFEVTVNGIYVNPEFTDEFVAENLSEYASTAEEYRAYVKETNERSNLETAVATKLGETVTANSYEENYLKQLKSISKYEQESYYESYNQMYYSFMGSYPYSSFEEYTGMTSSQFEDYLTELSQARFALVMTYQYIFDDAGLTITDEDYQAKVDELGSTSEETYGKPYMMQTVMQDKVIDYLADIATVTTE
ncbi:MAG: FKBP-type peptidyl-prolyl cis-trans isomerase [Lachnospiraceae bacterium]|nr:FKBP-type peptidyl-prolyl cis-trans isomerase [Lachnospiraceae bacterium]